MGKEIGPPKFLEWILGLILKNEDKSHRLGDFQDVFVDISRQVSKLSATKWYCRQILTGMPKLFCFFIYWRFLMFKKYFKTTFRNLRRNKIFSFINLGGLAFGIACGLLILLWIFGELSYDKFHVHKENIYRITQKHKFEGHSATTYLPLAKKLKSDFPRGVKKIVRFLPAKGIFKTDVDNIFKEDNVYYVDEQFSDLFSFPLSMGEKTQVLKRPNTVIITERISKKYFGSANPLGKIIKYKNLEITEEIEKSLEVTGVLKNIPPNSHIKFDFLISISTFSKLKDFEQYHGWHWPPTYTYVLLQDKNTLTYIKNKLTGFKKKHLPGDEAKVRDFIFQPLIDIHLKSHLKYELESNGNITHVFIFSVVAIFVIFIACFNYINLSTAWAARRAKEVGLKKVLGAKPANLVFQFMGESFGFTLFAFILALGIVHTVLPFFNNMLDKEMNYFASILQFPFFLWFQVLFLVLIGFFAGFYPAVFLSKFKPANIFRGKSRFESGVLRRILVITQFTVSAILISGMVIVYKQMNFIQNKDLGFARDNTIVVPLWGNNILSKLSTLANNIHQNPNIKDFTAYSNIIGANDRIYAYPIKAQGIPDGKQLEMSTLVVDYNFIDAFKLEMVEGRGFSDKIAADKDRVIINEKAKSLLKWDKPLGKKITIKYIKNGKDHTGTVIGVVKDFNIRTLHHEVEPLVMFVNDKNSVDYLISYISFKVNSNNISSALAYFKNQWNRLESEKLFEYIFLDERIRRQYQGEHITKTLIKMFSSLAILIACFGLFGLASFITTARSKEIGIRRVLGASKTGLTFLLSNGYLQPIYLLYPLPGSW
ncbi:MAG: ABC transporter permease [Candidatus Thorarchaeota archaeon]